MGLLNRMYFSAYICHITYKWSQLDNSFPEHGSVKFHKPQIQRLMEDFSSHPGDMNTFLEEQSARVKAIVQVC